MGAKMSPNAASGRGSSLEQVAFYWGEDFRGQTAPKAPKPSPAAEEGSAEDHHLKNQSVLVISGLRWRPGATFVRLGKRHWFLFQEMWKSMQTSISSGFYKMSWSRRPCSTSEQKDLVFSKTGPRPIPQKALTHAWAKLQYNTVRPSSKAIKSACKNALRSKEGILNVSCK